MTLLEKAPDWYTQGLCWGRPDLTPLFFPDTDDNLCNEGRQYCQRCPVATQCREYAIVNEIHHGLWGGLTPRERERYRKNPAAFVLRLIECEECGTPLTGHQRMFCGQACVRRASRRRGRQGQILPVNCRLCGKEYVRINPAQVLCSPECRKEALTERQRVRRQTPRQIACWTCGEPVLPAEGHSQKYCSAPCRAKARAAHKADSQRRNA